MIVVWNGCFLGQRSVNGTMDEARKVMRVRRITGEVGDRGGYTVVEVLCDQSMPLTSVYILFFFICVPLWRKILIEMSKNMKENVVIRLCVRFLLWRLWCFLRRGRLLHFQFRFPPLHAGLVLLTDFHFRSGLFTLASLS